MELTRLVAKPQLIKLTIDDADIVEQYGEPIDFWTWDRQPLDIFLKLNNTVDRDQAETMQIIRSLVLDSEGKPAIGPDEMLPVRVMVQVVTQVMLNLGK